MERSTCPVGRLLCLLSGGVLRPWCSCARLCFFLVLWSRADLTVREAPTDLLVRLAFGAGRAVRQVHVDTVQIPVLGMQDPAVGVGSLVQLGVETDLNFAIKVGSCSLEGLDLPRDALKAIEDL